MALLGTAPATAQVLARPGWAGSGVTPEAWWVRAVFYRVDPARFQDSDGDGRGDLPGLIQRLDYLQALGVDAVLLDGNVDSKDNDALGDLVREASRRQLRVLVTANPQSVTESREALVTLVRSWLGAGAAGVMVPRPTGSDPTNSSYASLVISLRSIVQSYPGERVLLVETAPVSNLPAPRPIRLTRHIDPGSFNAAHGTRLLSSIVLPLESTGLSQLRSTLDSIGNTSSSGINSLLQLSSPPATASADAAGDAALLLGSKGAMVLDFGEELGLNLYSAPLGAANTTALPVMQWTPSNRTQASVAQSDTKPSAAGNGEPQFGAYHPYVPPPRGLVGAPSARLRVTPDLNIPDALPDPDSLSGFTSGTLPLAPIDGIKLNAITEDRDPRSLLNAYRQLIALHHGNATLRNGPQATLNRDAEGALVWVRRAPAGSRTAANVLLAVNRTDQPVSLAVSGDLAQEGMRPGALRPLFSSATEATTGETTEHLFLPPHAVFVGEVYHSGSIAEPVAHTRHSGRRSRRRSRR